MGSGKLEQESIQLLAELVSDPLMEQTRDIMGYFKRPKAVGNLIQLDAPQTLLDRSSVGVMDLTATKAEGYEHSQREVKDSLQRRRDSLKEVASKSEEGNLMEGNQLMEEVGMSTTELSS